MLEHVAQSVPEHVEISVLVVQVHALIRALKAVWDAAMAVGTRVFLTVQTVVQLLAKVCVHWDAVARVSNRVPEHVRQHARVCV